jgi:uncharacterized membrane protein
VFIALKPGIKKSTSCTYMYISVTIVFIALKPGIKKSTSCTYISVTIVFIALKQGIKKPTSCTYISVTIVFIALKTIILHTLLMHRNFQGFKKPNRNCNFRNKYNLTNTQMNILMHF